jgi:nucleoside-diphosphate-sugar epimerase
MKVLLLGSNGFIGKALSTKLEKIHDLVKVNRETDLENLVQSDQLFDFIINCSSSRPKASVIEAHQSNYLYPKQVFHRIPARNWVQIESYFQIQIPFGRMDPYSIEKHKFSRFLDDNEKSGAAPIAYHLYMPHIFGENDRPERLISSAITSFRSGKDFQTSSGAQLLPILHVSDAVEGIVRFIDNPKRHAACTPFWYGTVRELLELISTQFLEAHISYGIKPDPIDASFPPVGFPQRVEGWEPKMQVNEFLEWVRCQGEES